MWGLTFTVQPLNSKLLWFFPALCQRHWDDNQGGILTLGKGNIYYFILRKDYFITLDSCHYFGSNGKITKQMGVACNSQSTVKSVVDISEELLEI